MELLLLKSAACLAIFMAFYKLLLEKRSFHHFKRYYLLSALILSLVIPLITFTTYVHVGPEQDLDTLINPLALSVIDPEFVIEDFTLNWPAILWTIYGFGCIVFASKFVLNLQRLYLRIKHNEKQKTSHFIHVLLKDMLPPHTFFNYIFLNKTKVENRDIPKEVILHEQTHAEQKHSIDILFIELLQVIFWFNPLFYFIKKDIKLNHEFLADAAVLKKGISTKTYQEILLQFSSNEHNFQLANAINYSSIKKRFTLMKTQTSKTNMWLSTFLLLPLLALVLFSFSSRHYEPTDPQIIKVSSIGEQEKGASKKEVAEYNSWANKMKTKFSKMSESDKVEGHPHIINDETFRYHISIYKRMTENQKNNAVSLPQAVLVSEWPMPTGIVVDKTYNQQNPPTKKEIADYNAWAKPINKKMADVEKKEGSQKLNAYPIVKVKDVKKYKAIYNRMTEAQKKNSEPWPNFPPPPPPPPAPKAKKADNNVPPPPPPPKPIKNVEVKEIEVPSPPPPPVSKTVVEKYAKEHPESITKTKVNGEVVEIIEMPLPPPPPPPMTVKEGIKYIIKKGIPIYLNGQIISSEAALKLADSNKIEKIEHEDFDGKTRAIISLIKE